MLLTALRRHGLCGRHLPRPHYPPRAGLKPDPFLYLGASDSACTDAHSSRLRPVAVSIQTAGVHVPQPAGPVRGRQEDLSQARLCAQRTLHCRQIPMCSIPATETRTARRPIEQDRTRRGRKRCTRPHSSHVDGARARACCVLASISQHHPELWQPGWDIRTGDPRPIPQHPRTSALTPLPSRMRIQARNGAREHIYVRACALPQLGGADGMVDGMFLGYLLG